MESEARLVMIDGGLPPPVLQYEVVDLDGRTLAAGLRLAGTAASRPSTTALTGTADRTRFSATAAALAALQDLGWVIVPIIAEDVQVPACRTRRAGSRRSAREPLTQYARVRKMPACNGVSVVQTRTLAARSS